MKPTLLLAFGLLVVNLCHSQTAINLEGVHQHVGDSVTVCGKVYSGRYLESANNSPTFLNIGAKYPDQLLTALIWNDVRKQLGGKPEDDYNNKEICISGKVELYKDKPQIVIKKPEQIRLKE